MASLSPTTYSRWASDGHSWTECFMDQSGRAYFQTCFNRFCSKRTLLTMWLWHSSHWNSFGVTENWQYVTSQARSEYLLGIHTGQAPWQLFASVENLKSAYNEEPRIKRSWDSLKTDTEGNRAYVYVTRQAPTARQIHFIPSLLPLSFSSLFFSFFLEINSHSLCSLGWLDEFLLQKSYCLQSSWDLMGMSVPLTSTKKPDHSRTRPAWQP